MIGWREVSIMTVGEFFYWLRLKWKVSRLTRKEKT